MQFRSTFSAGLMLAGVIAAPVSASAQTMMMAPLPPPRPIDLAVVRSADAVALDPDAALRSSVAARVRVAQRQQVLMQETDRVQGTDRDIPMPRPVPSIMAPVRP